jgi:hypothetical protein
MNHSPIILKNDEFASLDTELFETVIEGRNATYISVPITTGKRFVDWWRQRGRRLAEASSELYDEEHYRAVVQPNLDAARRRISRIRSETPGIVIEPTPFKKPEWDQKKFRKFWAQVIQRFVSAVIFLEGWEYSSGCSYEYLIAYRSGVKTLDEKSHPLPLTRALAMIRHSIEETTKCSAPIDFLQNVFDELQADVQLGHALDDQPLPKAIAESTTISEDLRFKDAILDRLAEFGNVAQFVSFSPDLKQRYSRISGFDPQFLFKSPERAIDALLRSSPEALVNVRSYRPEQSKGQPLRYGLKSVSEVMDVLRENQRLGNFSIVNETVDIHDGGVSGVALGDIIEFSPDDSPQCVEKPGTCALPRHIGLLILERVYGFWPIFTSDPSIRVEFSIHPKRRGLSNDHTLLWELEQVGQYSAINLVPEWPNNFSRLVGDKAFGLLIADAIGLRVPKMTVISRRIAPFTFGQSTGTGETWIRTCPRERAPGKYPTFFGWQDPFALLADEEAKSKLDPRYVPIVSVISQDAVTPEFSGSSAPFFEGELIEGRRGRGDEFMLGHRGPEQLPNYVFEAGKKSYQLASKVLGPVEMEWVFDGRSIWVVQLNLSKAPHFDQLLDHVRQWQKFDVKEGLDNLQNFVDNLDRAQDGVILVGDVGITSHFGDILRAAGLPFRIEKPS